MLLGRSDIRSYINISRPEVPTANPVPLVIVLAIAQSGSLDFTVIGSLVVLYEVIRTKIKCVGTE